MIKKLYVILSFLSLIFIVACSGNEQSSSTQPQIVIPQELVIKGNTISFEALEGAKNKAVIWEEGKEGTYQYRVINSGTDIYSLNLTPAKYFMYLEISYNGQTVKTNTEEFTIQDLNAIGQVEAEYMIDSTVVKMIGRNYYDENKKAVMMYHSGSGFTVKFEGTSVTADLYATNASTSWKRPYISIIVDNDLENPRIVALEKMNYNDFILAEGLTEGEHEVTVIKRSEALDSFFGVKEVHTDGKFLPKEDKDLFIEILGDSTIAGYGNETKLVNGKYEDKTSANSNIMKTFAYVTAQELNADYSIVCASGWGLTGSMWTTPQTVNLFETYRRYYATYDTLQNKHVYSDENYKFSEGRVADIVIISVGTNDLYYIEDAYKQSNLLGEQRKQKFIDDYKELCTFISSIYNGVEIFMVYGAMGETRMYSTVEAAYQNVSATMNNVHLVKLTGDQGAIDYHPSAASHVEMSSVLIQEIKKVKNL